MKRKAIFVLCQSVMVWGEGAAGHGKRCGGLVVVACGAAGEQPIEVLSLSLSVVPLLLSLLASVLLLAHFINIIFQLHAGFIPPDQYKCVTEKERECATSPAGQRVSSSYKIAERSATKCNAQGKG